MKTAFLGLRAAMLHRPVDMRNLLRNVRLQIRTYAKPTSRKSTPPKVAVQPVPQPKVTPREVLVDPFKPPPPPRPNYAVLIKPAIFTAAVLFASDWLADKIVQRRAHSVQSRADRGEETRWTIFPMIGINVAVFFLWRTFPSLLHRAGALLVAYNPTPSQLVVSSFSHQELWHLCLNQIAFYSFGSLACDLLGREYFLALYLKAACISSLASVSVTQFFVSRGIWPRDRLAIGSLGQSGVLFSMLGVSALTYPDLKVTILFLPLALPIKFVVPSLMCLDAVGVAARWQTFDHVAHVTQYNISTNLLVGWCRFWLLVCVQYRVT
jgi:membrane associated rhomboid family serine protease